MTKYINSAHHRNSSIRMTQNYRLRLYTATTRYPHTSHTPNITDPWRHTHNVAQRYTTQPHTETVTEMERHNDRERLYQLPSSSALTRLTRDGCTKAPYCLGSNSKNLSATLSSCSNIWGFSRCETNYFPSSFMNWHEKWNRNLWGVGHKVTII